MAATAIRVPLTRLRLGRLADDRLAELAAGGDELAFEQLYDRHHAALLGFCRHMLGSREEGEDALQQTFLRAHRALVSRGAPDEVRPWLFAIARNRCRTIHAARKDAAVPDADAEPVTDGLAADLEQRADLRALLADIDRLPEDQRSALVLAELADMPHVEIGAVIGVPAAKVKALIHQARSHLIAERDARETPCEQIREQLANARGGELRRGPLRRHLNLCEPCREYKRAVADQRVALGLLLPVIPSAGLKDAVLGAIGGGGGGAAAAAAGGAAAGSAALSGGGSAAGLGAKLAIGAALLGGAGGGTALVQRAVTDPPAAASEAASKAPARAGTPAKRTVTPTVADTERTSGAGGRTTGNPGTSGGARGDEASRGKRKAHAYGKIKKAARGDANNGNHGARGGSGDAGARGETRKAEVQQRNTERKAAKLEQRATRRQASTTPKKAVPRRTTPVIPGGNGTANGRRPATATPAPVATADPIASIEPTIDAGRTKRPKPADAELP